MDLSNSNNNILLRCFLKFVERTYTSFFFLSFFLYYKVPANDMYLEVRGSNLPISIQFFFKKTSYDSDIVPTN